MRATVLALSVAALLAGCVSRPPMTRDEYLALTTRTIAGMNKEQALAVAEKLFVLLDGDDFEFMHNDGGMVAVRKWHMILAGGTDTWTLSATDVPGGVRIQVGASYTEQGMAPMPVTGGAWTVGAMPGTGSPVSGNVVYHAFWARMDYLLGKRSDWLTCGQINDKVVAGEWWGRMAMLCDVTLKDVRPDQIASK